MANEILTGVYRITCTANGRSYIGHTSKSFQARWDAHRRELRRGVHHSPCLQMAWNKYGEDAFEFCILEPVSKSSELLEVEQKWIDFYQAANRVYGFNINPIAAKPPCGKGRKRSPESVEKSASAHRGMKRSPETCQKISESKKGLKPSPEAIAKRSAVMKGRKVSPDVLVRRIGRKRSMETRMRIGAAHRGRRASDEARARMSADRKGKPRNPDAVKKTADALRGKKQSPEAIEKRIAPLRGRKLSSETRAKLSAVRKGRIFNPKAVKRWIVTNPQGESFEIENLSRFCKENGLNLGNLWAVAKGKYKQSKGWKCKEVE